MRPKAIATFLVLIVGGTLFAGPFFSRGRCTARTCPTSSPTSPISIGQSHEFKPEERPVPQPWLGTSATALTSSPQPDTVLEPVEGTGSRLPIGAKIPDKITHTVAPEVLAGLDKIIKNIPSQVGISTDPKMSQAMTDLAKALQQPGQVSIIPPTDQATSERLSRVLMLLEWLLWLGGGVFSASKLGTLLQWVAPVVTGLQSALQAQSQAQGQIPVATSSTPPSK